MKEKTIKKSVCLTKQEYEKMLKQMKPAEKISDFIKRKMFGVKK